MVNVYYPADANLLLAVGERAYRSVNCINGVFAGKQPMPCWLTLDEARAELEEGVAEWEWASNVEPGERPDVVVATCGDVPTLEGLAATDMLRVNDMDRWALASDALRMVDAERWATQIGEWEAFRDEAYDFCVREGYDHPAFTDWVWPEVRGLACGAAVNSGTGGDNDVDE